MSEVIVDTAGTGRCAWCGTDPEYQRYHDEEWGLPQHDSLALFEKICLEGFQAGLSWITILRRRPGIREAFHHFQPRQVAAMTDADIKQLMTDRRIIRNHQKIIATITNAQAYLALDTPLSDLIWSFAPPTRLTPPATRADVPAITPESTALSTELRRRNFRFVGPTTAYALMQSVGMTNDHIAGCFRATPG
ncbi:MAG: 3-methyladenine DNA glycosylase [Candidatus Lumbricidophila eiseniae]|uniref:3-methyladenine DNA glycosylase n=1 Tax=Candidatus Lumbricidiphila eiseniae TaxID=1969409 RepID=A0A2A6FNR9_9MICO|nr:MAG: 3-methyladenine DNA glycosylase [Candidatus Lumbricidophila eiseniae]